MPFFVRSQESALRIVSPAEGCRAIRSIQTLGIEELYEFYETLLQEFPIPYLSPAKKEDLTFHVSFFYSQLPVAFTNH